MKPIALSEVSDMYIHLVVAVHIPGESKKKFKRFAGNVIKIIWSILKTKMLIYHSKAYLD